MHVAGLPCVCQLMYMGCDQKLMQHCDEELCWVKMVYSTAVLCNFVKQSEVLSICSCAGEIIVQCTSVA